jgi:hypothetical protein
VFALDPLKPLSEEINRLLAPHIGSFRATASSIVDINGAVTDIYSSVVHEGIGEDNAVSIANVAAVIDCYDTLTSENLQTGYGRIKTVKSIQKPDPVIPVRGEIHLTTGIIIARNSDLSLDAISSEMGRLNVEVPSHYWPDAVGVLSDGLVNYSALTPASQQSGNFFLPTEPIDASTPVPSLWVQKIIWPVGFLTFNKIASLIVARVSIFQPGIKVSDYRELVKDMPSHSAATQTYQFNRSSVLVPMTKERAIAARLPQETFNIVSGRDKLGSVQYQSWQDGGVFVVRGRFPLDIFLAVLNEIVPGLSAHDMQYFRGENVQVSYVLPVSRRQFLETLALFDRRSSNMTIQREESKILVQKVGDEGTTSPFFARLMIGVLSIRDCIYVDKDQQSHFDDLYDPVLSGLRNVRETSRDIAKEWEEHRTKIESGEIVKRDGRNVHITEHIDRSLRRDLESFLNTAVRTIKHSLQGLTKELGLEIDFLFQKDSAFRTGVAKLRESDAALGEYLIATRLWSEPLVLTRNNLEHGTIPSPKVSYSIDSFPLQVGEPQFAGRPITQFTIDVLGRVCCFCEELIVHGLRKQLPKGFEITEVPFAERDPTAPVRFQVTIASGGRARWELVAHTKPFNEA